MRVSLSKFQIECRETEKRVQTRLQFLVISIRATVTRNVMATQTVIQALVTATQTQNAVSIAAVIVNYRYFSRNVFLPYLEVFLKIRFQKGPAKWK